MFLVLRSLIRSAVDTQKAQTTAIRHSGSALPLTSYGEACAYYSAHSLDVRIALFRYRGADSSDEV